MTAESADRPRSDAHPRPAGHEGFWCPVHGTTSAEDCLAAPAPSPAAQGDANLGKALGFRSHLDPERCHFTTEAAWDAYLKRINQELELAEKNVQRLGFLREQANALRHG